MCKYQIGDRVVCIMKDGESDRVYNDIGTVLDIQNYREIYRLGVE